MARNNYFLRKLSSYVSRPPSVQGDDIIDFKGGLNLSKAPHLIDRDQSPDMVNLLYDNGGLYPRGGVKKYFDGLKEEGENPLFKGNVGACYERPFFSAQGNPFLVFTADRKLFGYEVEHLSDTGEEVSPQEEEKSLSEIEVSGGAVIPADGGTFFELNGTLYYKGKGCYIKIKNRSPWGEGEVSDIRGLLLEMAKATGQIGDDIKTFDEWLSKKGGSFFPIAGAGEVKVSGENAKAYVNLIRCREFVYRNYFLTVTEEGDTEENKVYTLKKDMAWGGRRSPYNYIPDKVNNYIDYAVEVVGDTVYSNCEKAYTELERLLGVLVTHFEGLGIYTEEQKDVIEAEKNSVMDDIKDLICPKDYTDENKVWYDDGDDEETDGKLTLGDNDPNEFKDYYNKLKKLGNLKMEVLKEYVYRFVDFVYRMPTTDILKRPFEAVSLVNAEDVYVPLVAINAVPSDGSGATLLQSENRLSSFIRIKYNGDGSTTQYKIPEGKFAIDTTLPISVKIDGEEVADDALPTVLEDRETFEFEAAPSAGTNNVEIKFGYYRVDDYAENTTDVSSDARNSVDSFMSCDVACVYGGGYEDSIVVFAGSDKQKNAYFWSGIGEVADPTYIPFDYYNLASESSEKIVALGVQQAFLAIFSEHSVGRANLGIENVGGLDLISLDYVSINSKIGCDIPNSVQLVENCLIFANSYSGVYRLQETSDYSENNVVRISENINKELLPKLRNARKVVSYDDGTYYGLAIHEVERREGESVDEHKYTTYLWDYSLYHYYSDENTLAWFKWVDVPIFCTFRYKGEMCYGARGRFIRLDKEQRYDDSDEGEKPIAYRYTVAPSLFKTYLYKKEVLKVIFTCDVSIPTDTEILYITDYEPQGRRDLSNLVVDDKQQYLYTEPFVRKPRALRIHHMAIRLDCEKIGKALSLTTVQVMYRYMQENR